MDESKDKHSIRILLDALEQFLTHSIACEVTLKVLSADFDWELMVSDTEKDIRQRVSEGLRPLHERFLSERDSTVPAPLPSDVEEIVRRLIESAKDIDRREDET